MLKAQVVAAKAAARDPRVDAPPRPYQIARMRELLQRCLAFAGLLVSACSAGSDPFGGGGSGQGAAQSATSSFDQQVATASSGMACTTPPQCSADLRNVLCDGQVVKTCSDLEGCANGGCVSACEATKANKSSVGCEYFVSQPVVPVSEGACHAAFVANAWSVPTKLMVERGGQTLDVTEFARIPQGSGLSLTYQPLANGELLPGQVAILFLAQYMPGKMWTPACPPGITTALFDEQGALNDTGIAQAFRIASDVPVVAYDIFPYGGGASAVTGATLLLPTSVWDTNYLGVNPFSTPPNGSGGWSWLQIIAAEKTEVTISPSAAIVGSLGSNDVPPRAQGVPLTQTLDVGEVLQFLQPVLLDGSPIQSNKPVGLVGGNTCANIPSDMSSCDAAHQMLPPVRALGFEYTAVPHRNRFSNVPENPPWRVVGAVSGTTLSFDPPIAGAPAVLSAGQVVEFFAGTTPFVVKSQGKDHPFYMSAHMTGCSTVSQELFLDCRGDPETVNVVPPSQFLSNYLFFTDPTYPETTLTVIRKRTMQGFLDVTLDCLGTITGWSAMGTSGEYEFAYVELSRGNYEAVGACNNGVHQAHSEGPFGITVWGWGSGATGGDPDNVMFPYSQYVSYAYPAGAGVRSVTDVVVPVPK